MATTNFITKAQAADSIAAIYTAPSGGSADVKTIWVHNKDSAAHTIRLAHVNNSSGSAGTEAAGDEFFNQPIAAGASMEVSASFPWALMAAGDSIQAEADVAAKVNIHIMGAVTV